MKKKLLILIFMMMLVPCLVNAEDTEGCTIVSGDGSNIGDEIACGTEHFYILSNDGEEVKMLSKYNLYVGRTYYKVEFDQTFDNISAAKNYWNEKYASEYDGYARYLANDDSEYYGILAYKNIEYEEVKQSSEAIGAHGDLKVEPLFPEVGVYNNEVDYDFMNNYSYPAYWEGKNVYKDGYIDFEINLNSTKDAGMLDYFKDYYKYLEGQGIVVEDITILSVSDINNLVYDITGEELPLTDWWYGEWGTISNNPMYSYKVIGRISDYLEDSYSWLWATTYWTRTIPKRGGNTNIFFIDTLGDLCTGNFCEVSVGAGVRPVVTMSSDNLIYNIETKTDGNGTVTANKVQGVEGDEVEFTVEAMSGYQLKKVVVTTSTGETLEFKNYKFTMPNTNVEIYAEFEKIENPNTGLNNPFIICGSIFGIALVGSLVIKKKKYI